jgi:hypothetical protein
MTDPLLCDHDLAKSKDTSDSGLDFDRFLLGPHVYVKPSLLLITVM